MMPTIDQKAAQKAIDALVKALGYETSEIQEISVMRNGRIRVTATDRSVRAAASVKPFEMIP